MNRYNKQRFIDTKKTVISNSIYNSLGWVIQTGLNLILISLIIKRIGINEFGIYAIALTIVGYFSIIQGLNQAALKYISEYHVKNDLFALKQVISTSLLISILIGAVGLFLLSFFSSYLATDVFNIPAILITKAKLTFNVIGIGFLFTTVSLTLMSIPQGLQRYDISNKITTSTGIMNFIISIVSIYFVANIIFLVLVIGFTSFINIIIFFIVSKKLLNGMSIKPGYYKIQFKKVLSFTSYSIFSSLVSAISFTLDRIIIGIMIGTHGIANYSVAQLPSSRSSGLSTKLIEILLPVTSQLSVGEKKEDIPQMVIKASRYILLLNMSINVPIIFGASDILNIWVGSSIAGNVKMIMSILGVSFLIRSLGGISTIINLGFGRPERNTKYAIIVFLITAILIYPLIKYFGILGAAITSLISSLVIPFYIYETNKLIKISSIEYIQRVIWKPLLIGLFQAIFIELMLSLFQSTLINVIFIFIISIFLNIILSFISKTIDEDYKAILKKATMYF